MNNHHPLRGFDNRVAVARALVRLTGCTDQQALRLTSLKSEDFHRYTRGRVLPTLTALTLLDVPVTRSLLWSIVSGAAEPVPYSQAQLHRQLMHLLEGDREGCEMSPLACLDNPDAGPDRTPLEGRPELGEFAQSLRPRQRGRRGRGRGKGCAR